MMCHYPADGSAALTLKYNNIPWQILQGLFGKLTKFFVVFCVKLRAQHAAQPGRDVVLLLQIAQQQSGVIVRCFAGAAGQHQVKLQLLPCLFIFNMRDNGFQVQLFLAALGLFDHHGVFGCVVSIQRSGGAAGR